MEDIHGRLRILREEERLSLREMASRVQSSGRHRVSHDSVRRYEEGRAPPSSYVTAVCSVFNVSCEWLLFGRGAKRPSESSQALAALEEIAAIITALRDQVSKRPGG